MLSLLCYSRKFIRKVSYFRFTYNYDVLNNLHPLPLLWLRGMRRVHTCKSMLCSATETLLWRQWTDSLTFSISPNSLRDCFPIGFCPLKWTQLSCKIDSNSLHWLKCPYIYAHWKIIKIIELDQKQTFPFLFYIPLLLSTLILRSQIIQV